MKKLLSIILALLIGTLGLTGCTGEVEQTNESLTVAYYGTASEYSDDALSKAAYLFREAYPDVELIIEREPYAPTSEGQKAYYTQLSTEIMSGKGPDLFWIDTYYMDVYKMMDAGAFADLAPFADADPDFAGDAYNTAVLNGSRYKEHLYVMPLSYVIPGLLARKELLDEVDLDYGACTDCVSQWEALARYTERYNAGASLPKPVWLAELIEGFPNYTGIPWLDVENKQADLSDPRWKTVFDSYGLLYNTMTEDQKAGLNYTPVTVEELTGRDFLFQGYENSISLLDMVSHARFMAKSGTPIFYPFYDVNGGVQARVTQSVGVRRTSPNQQNAYNFIKLLLEPEVQALHGDIAPHAAPVSNQALKENLEENQKELSGLWMFSNKEVDLSDFRPLPDETVQSILEAAKKVDGVYFMNDARRQLFTSMADYLEGKVSYEEAVKEAEAALKIYVSE